MIDNSHLLRYLTERELEIFNGVISGKSNSEVAESLGLTAVDVKRYMTTIMRKAGVETRTLLMYGHHMGNLTWTRSAERRTK